MSGLRVISVTPSVFLVIKLTVIRIAISTRDVTIPEMSMLSCRNSR